MHDGMHHVGPICSSPKEKLLPNIDGIHIVGGKVALTPVAVLTRLTYAIVISVPAEEHNIHITYITTCPTSGAHAFSTAWIALYTLRERIHVLRMRLQDIPRSTCPRCTVVTSRTTDT
jgi:hypothetical protein